MTIATLPTLLASHCLTVMGTCTHNDGVLALIGPDEPAFWGVFSTSPEYQDGKINPLDRWSQRILTAVAESEGAQVHFPFGGPPYLPFYTWALNTGRFWTSPINFLVHEEAGLWGSFRGALQYKDQSVSNPDVQSPCPSCAQPCKSACPVGAFDDGYNVAACKAHISSPAGRDCMTGGCLARRACPVGQGKRAPAQAAFHMEAFL